MLSSRERILRCIRHEPIDRVPVSTYELCGWNEDAWENKEPTYVKLMDAIRKNTDCIYMSTPYMDQGPDPSCDTENWNEGESYFTRRTFHSKSGDLTGLFRVDLNIHTTWTLEHYLKDIEDIDKYLSIPYRPLKFDYETFSKQQTGLGDKGVMMISIPDPICAAASLFEMGTFLVHAVTEPEKTKYFLDAIFERQMVELRDILRYDIRDVIFRICGPEYATPPYLSPRYYFDYVTSYLIKMCREIKDAGGIPRIHCHGKIGKVIDQFAQTCADGLDPIEPIPDGDISLADVKKLYGRQFCLFGNLELKELERADEKRIDSLVKTAMDEAKEGSGFILMPTAAPISVPLSEQTERNYLQMMESAHKYGSY